MGGRGAGGGGEVRSLPCAPRPFPLPACLLVGSQISVSPCPSLRPPWPRGADGGGDSAPAALLAAGCSLGESAVSLGSHRGLVPGAWRFHPWRKLSRTRSLSCTEQRLAALSIYQCRGL